MDTEGEVWKDIKDWPFHQVSNRGRVRVLPGAKLRGGRGRRIATEVRLKKQSPDSDGYMRTKCPANSLIPGQKGRNVCVHILVLNAFFGPCPLGRECRHLNGNPSDNHPENLVWGSPKENGQDKIKHGTSGKGERSGRAKLTQSEVDDIKSREKYYGVNMDLAREFGVSHETIRQIREGLTWVAVSQ